MKTVKTINISLFAVLMLLLAFMYFPLSDEKDEVRAADNGSVFFHVGSNISYVNESPQVIKPEYPGAAPFLSGGNTYIPLRFLFSQLHMAFFWEPEKERISFVNDRSEMVTIYVNDNTIILDRQSMIMDVPLIERDNIMYISLKVLMKTLGDKIVRASDGFIAIQDQGSEPINSDEEFLIKFKSTLPYLVYQGDRLLDGFDNEADAIQFAKQWSSSTVKLQDGNTIWDNMPLLNVYNGKELLGQFHTFTDAVVAAKAHKESRVELSSGLVVWRNEKLDRNWYGIPNVPLTMQLPELPRGCEVSSLTMLLHFYGVKADKLTLAKQIKKDTTPYRVAKGQVHYGNPHDGFIGDMYSYDKPGLGVYHGPIYELADRYLPGRAVDMTGADFEDMLYPIRHGEPVWVIINTEYDQLADAQFQTWITPRGPIKITYKLHAVLITGYDENYIYFNDPLNGVRKEPRSSFKRGWEQMGRQAISVAR